MTCEVLLVCAKASILLGLGLMVIGSGILLISDVLFGRL